ncbi:hypothetical protein IZY60_05595 [Lutibacter sp. B2]|nr:hypothetical protein [Lutibacter sp. B2]
MGDTFVYEQIIFILTLLNEKDYNIRQLYNHFTQNYNYSKKEGSFRIDLKSNFPKVYCKEHGRYYYYYQKGDAYSKKAKDHIAIEYPEYIKVNIQKKNASMIKSIEENFSATFSAPIENNIGETIQETNDSQLLEDSTSIIDSHSKDTVAASDSEKISQGKEKCLETLKQNISTTTKELLNKQTNTSPTDLLYKIDDNVNGLLYKINGLEDRMNKHIKKNTSNVKKLYAYIDEVNKDNTVNIQILDTIINALTQLKKSMEG